VLAVVVLAANVQDRDGAKHLLGTGTRPWAGRMERIWADSAYAGPGLEDWVFLHHNCFLDIVPRAVRDQGFVLERPRWIVERTFGWLGQYRRLSKDYEYCMTSSAAMIQVAMINLMLRRLGRGGVTRWQRQTN
jgi:putative transposase